MWGLLWLTPLSELKCICWLSRERSVEAARERLATEYSSEVLLRFLAGTFTGSDDGTAPRQLLIPCCLHADHTSQSMTSPLHKASCLADVSSSTCCHAAQGFTL